MDLGNLPVEATLVALLIMSILTWVIGISKYLRLRRLQQESKTFLHRFWQSTDLATAEMQARGSNSDFAILAKAGFDAYAEYRTHPNSIQFYGDVHEVIERPLRHALATCLLYTSPSPRDS